MRTSGRGLFRPGSGGVGFQKRNLRYRTWILHTPFKVASPRALPKQGVGSRAAECWTDLASARRRGGGELRYC